MEVPAILTAIFNFILAIPKLIIGLLTFIIGTIANAVMTIIYLVINIGGGIYNLFVYIFPFKNKKYFKYLSHKQKKKGE